MAQIALEDIQRAVIKAHNSGDIDGAKRLSDIYKRQSTQMGPGLTAVQPQQQETDSALGYSVDQAQRMFGKGAEAIGRATGIKSVEDFGTRTVAQQDIDIQRGGYQPQYTGSLEDNFNQGGFSQAAGWLKEKAAENVATSGFMLGGAAATALTSAVSVPAAYIMGVATMGGGLALGTGEAAFEQEEKLGDYNEVLSVGAGSIIALLDRFGAGKVIPKSKLLKMTTQEITDELNKKGFTRAAVAFSRRALTEGATEAAQEGVSMGAATTRGAEYTPKEIRDRFIDAAALGTTYGAGVQTVTGPISAISGSSEPTTQAQAAFAQRLEEIARVNNLNLRDIDKTSTEGAREAVDKAHVQMTTRLKSLFRTLKDKVKPQTLDTLQELEDKVMLEAGYREARTKTKNVVGQQEIDATEKLIGEFGEGQEILNLYGELNEMTRLHNSQYQGGLSKYTDILSPLGSNVGYDKSVISSERVLRPLATGTLAMNTGGASLIPQVAVVGAGRAIDALTGRRSRVRRYVAKHKKKPGFSDIPQSAYLHEQNRLAKLAEQEEADKILEQREAANLEAARLGLPPHDDSPQGTLQSVLGVDPETLAALLEEMQANQDVSPVVRASARSAMTSINTGGKVPDLSLLMRHLKSRINPDPMFWQERARQMNIAEGRPPEQSRRDAAIQQGIEDNRAFVNKLKADLELETISPIVHKIKLQNALDIALLDLGSNPVLRLDSIRKNLTEDGVPDALIDRYFNPYVERVNQQQANRRPTPTRPEPVKAGDSIEVFDATGKPYTTTVVAVSENGTIIVKNEAGQDVILGSGPSAILENTNSPDYQLNTVGPEIRKATNNKRSIEELTPEEMDAAEKVLEKIYDEVPNQGAGVNALKDLNAIRNKRKRPSTSSSNFFLDDDSVEITESRQAPILSLAPGVNMLDVYEGREELPKIKTKAEAGKYLEDRALEKLGGIPRDLNNETNRDAIADDMVAEAIFEQQSQEKQNALQWYNQTVAKMLSMLSLKYPEINQDEVTRTPVLLSLAITSQNLDVPTNLKFAVKVYDHFNKTGKFPIIGIGTSLKVMKGNFEKANLLMDRLGPEMFTKFLQTEFTVKELNAILTKHLGQKTEIGGELVDTTVYGSAVFGPKVGNGFYSNLRGDFSPVTMDMWFMRTIGRLQGKVLALEEGKFETQLARLKKALGRKRMSRDALITKAYELKKKHDKDFKDNRKDYDSGKKVKSEATKAANTIVTSLMTLRDTPVTGTERNQLRDIVTKAVSKYNEKTGMEITPAAFQALIWYPEQDLYKNLGVKLPATRADYASSTKRFLLEDGFNEEDISRAESIRISEESGPGPARQAAVQINEARSGQPGGRPSGTVLQENQSKPVLDSPTEQLNLIPPEIENFRGSRPTNARIKENIPEAEDIVKGYFDIGKEGGRYENGITDRADLDRLMTALGVTHIAVKKFSQLKAHAGVKAKDIDRRTLGFAAQDLRNNLVNSKIVTAEPGFKDIKGKPITDLEALVILVHEIGHTIEGRPGGNVDYSSVLNDAYSDINQVYNVEKVKGLSGLDENRPDLYGAKTHLVVGTHNLRTSTRNKVRSVDGIDPEGLNSFRYELYKLLSTDIPFLDKKKKAILSEIDKIRDTDFNISVSGMPGKTPLRGWGTLKKQFGVRQQAEDRAVKLFKEDRVKHRKEIRELTKQANDLDAEIMNYLYDPAEVAVDPLILYLMDPKGARKEIPVTAKFIRDFFNAPHNNIPIQFNSPPMVAILAIVLAAMATRDEEEEEKQRVPGALGMNPGALSMI